MKKIIFSISLLLVILSSCSKDTKKITITSEHVSTGDVTDITATTATLKGYYNFYGAMSQCFDESFFDTTDEEESYPLKDLAEFLTALEIESDLRKHVYVYGRNPEHVYDSDTIVLDTLGGHKEVTIVTTAEDVNFLDAGFYIAESRDFSKQLRVESVGNWDRVTKVKNIEHTITELKPDNLYFYKTFIAFCAVCSVAVPELELDIHKNIADYFDYYFYGDTETFRTLAK